MVSWLRAAWSTPSCRCVPIVGGSVANRCSKCDTAMKPENTASDGGCKNCITIKLYQLDTMMVDEHGFDVWARTLARRYREQMENFIRLKGSVSNFSQTGRYDQ